jgi:hypothetical protein
MRLAPPWLIRRVLFGEFKQDQAGSGQTFQSVVSGFISTSCNLSRVLFSSTSIATEECRRGSTGGSSGEMVGETAVHGNGLLAGHVDGGRSSLLICMMRR